MGVVFDNTLVHFRGDGTFLYTTEEELEQLRSGTTQSWTPTLAFGGASTGITYSVQTGSYIRVGRVLYYFGRILLTSKGSSTGDAAISVPVTTINDAGIGGFVSYSNMSSMAAPMLSGAGSAVRIRNQGATEATDATDANFANNTDIYFSGFYLTS